MLSRFSARTIALWQALFVTFLWATSWVLVKVGLEDIPPVAFAGLRYGLAFICLCALIYAQPERRARLNALTRRQWRNLALLGMVFVAVTQGALFVALSYLPATMLTLLINATAIIVALAGIVFLNERPAARQWLGVLIFIAGLFTYLYPVFIPQGQTVGLLAALVVVGANAASALLGRRINRGGQIDPFTVTFVSMGVGGLLLLALGISVSGWPTLSLTNWAIIGWLAVVNTAFAFVIWNHTLRTLSAIESSIINNTLLIQVALLAVIFLGERLTAQEVVGLGLAALGILLVQWRRSG